MEKNLLIGIVVIVVAIGSFFGGTVYQKSQDKTTSTVTDTQGGPSGIGGQGFSRGGGSGFRGGTNGIVASISGNIMTVTATDGSTKTVTLDSSTTVTKSQAITAADIATGQTVLVMGTTNSDGTVTAKNISIR